MKLRILFIILVLFTEVFCGQNRTKQGVKYAMQELQNALQNKIENQAFTDTLIKDNETAIAISEAILFKVYGKDNITKQRPYEVYLINGYWVVFGTLPDRMLGGTFLIIIKASNGEVIKVTHYK